MTANDRLAEIKARVEAVSGFPGYEVTSEGEVYSNLNWRGYGKRRITPTPAGGGYLKVRLRHPDGRRVNRKVHYLVSRAFLGPKPPGLQVRHLNGDQTDNRVSNLRYGTAKENAVDREAHGRTARGERNGYATLTEAAVVGIRKMLTLGLPYTDIASEYGVAPSTVGMIARGQRWTHVA